MKELQKIEKLNPVEIFKTDGIQSIIDSIRAEVAGIVPDTSTAKGRKEISSLAFEVSKSKNLIDKMGKTLSAFNAERRLARDQLDNIRDEVRALLTQWEDEEKEREKAAD